jgi:hypothetical protein
MQLLWNLWCDKTSEASRDEIYFQVYVHTQEMRPVGSRVPASGTIRFNDQPGTKRNENNIVLLDMPLHSGEGATIVVGIWEQDGDTLNINIQDLVEISIKDEDDLIGVFSVRVDNYQAFNVSWQAISKVVSEVPEDQTGGGPGSYGFRFNGDGSDYFGWGVVIP